MMQIFLWDKHGLLPNGFFSYIFWNIKMEKMCDHPWLHFIYYVKGNIFSLIIFPCNDSHQFCSITFFLFSKVFCITWFVRVSFESFKLLILVPCPNYNKFNYPKLILKKFQGTLIVIPLSYMQETLHQQSMINPFNDRSTRFLLCLL